VRRHLWWNGETKFRSRGYSVVFVGIIKTWSNEEGNIRSYNCKLAAQFIIWGGGEGGKLITAIYTYLLTYLLTPCSRVLLEKLTGSQLVKKFLTFYGTRRCITTFTSARHLSLSWASSIQCMSPHPTSWRSILILSSHLPTVFSLCSIVRHDLPQPDHVRTRSTLHTIQSVLIPYLRTNSYVPAKVGH